MHCMRYWGAFGVQQSVGRNDTISWLCWLLLSWCALTGMTQIVLLSSTWQVQESRWEILHHSCTCYLRSLQKNIIANSALLGLPSHHIECPVVCQSFQCPDRTWEMSWELVSHKWWGAESFWYRCCEGKIDTAWNIPIYLPFFLATLQYLSTNKDREMHMSQPMPFATEKNDIKESSGPNQLILRTLVSKDMVFPYKDQYGGGGDTYLISHNKNKSKQALLFKTAQDCLFCDIW